MAAEARVPKLNAMLLCERIIREEGTGLVSLIGVFETITSHQPLPLTLPSLWVYAKLAEAQGEYLYLKVIAEAPMPEPVSVDDPMATSELMIQLGGLTFTEAGHYDFRLSANGRFVDSKSMRIQVKSA